MTNTVLLLVVIALVCQACVSAPQGDFVQLESLGGGYVENGALDLGTQAVGENSFGKVVGQGRSAVEGEEAYSALASRGCLDPDSATGWQEGEAGVKEGVANLATGVAAGNEDTWGKTIGTGCASGENAHVWNSNVVAVQNEPECDSDDAPDH